MGHTIDEMEQQLRRTMDWKTRVMNNPAPYAATAAAAVFLVIGGPKRIFGAMRRPSKSKLEKLVEQLPEPLAEKLSASAQAVSILQDVPDNLRKVVRQAEKEREKLQ